MWHASQDKHTTPRSLYLPVPQPCDPCNMRGYQIGPPLVQRPHGVHDQFQSVIILFHHSGHHLRPKLRPFHNSVFIKIIFCQPVNTTNNEMIIRSYLQGSQLVINTALYQVMMNILPVCFYSSALYKTQLNVNNLITNGIHTEPLDVIKPFRWRLNEIDQLQAKVVIHGRPLCSQSEAN